MKYQVSFDTQICIQICTYISLCTFVCVSIREYRKTQFTKGVYRFLETGKHKVSLRDVSVNLGYHLLSHHLYHS